MHTIACPEITVDPDVRHGEAVFRGTRTPIAILWDYLETGQTLDAFLEDYPHVTRAQVLSVLSYARQQTSDHASAA